MDGPAQRKLRNHKSAQSEIDFAARLLVPIELDRKFWDLPTPTSKTQTQLYLTSGRGTLFSHTFCDFIVMRDVYKSYSWSLSSFILYNHKDSNKNSKPWGHYVPLLFLDTFCLIHQHMDVPAQRKLCNHKSVQSEIDFAVRLPVLIALDRKFWDFATPISLLHQGYVNVRCTPKPQTQLCLTSRGRALSFSHFLRFYRDARCLQFIFMVTF